MAHCGCTGEDYNFEPVRLVDCAGRPHEFHFRAHLFGPGVSLSAFELRNGQPAGYQFQIIGEPEEDPMALLGRLIARIRRGLAVKYLKNGELGLQLAGREVRARIDWDEDAGGRVPLLVVDGREITWDDLGEMLMTFEGFQFKLEIRDPGEEF